MNTPEEIKHLLKQAAAIKKYKEALEAELKHIDRETALFENVRLVRRAEMISNKFQEDINDLR